jgi:hypothetical protein
VPAEFLGLARAYRNQVHAADQACAVALRGIITPLRMRLARKPTLREENIVYAGRAWSAKPGWNWCPPHPFARRDRTSIVANPARSHQPGNLSSFRRR